MRSAKNQLSVQTTLVGLYCFISKHCQAEELVLAPDLRTAQSFACRVDASKDSKDTECLLTVGHL